MEKKNKYILIGIILVFLITIILLSSYAFISINNSTNRSNLNSNNLNVDNLKSSDLEAVDENNQVVNDLDLKGSVNPALRFRNKTTGEIAYYFDHDGKILATNATFSENISASTGIFTNIGSSLSRVVNGWFNNIDASGTANATEVNVNGNRVSTWLYNQTTPANSYSDSKLSSLNSTVAHLNGGNSFTGDQNFNGGWGSGGLSVIGGDIYVQTGYFYNITTLNVSTININGSLIPPTGNTFDIGSSSKTWANGYFGSDVTINGRTTYQWLYNQTSTNTFNSTYALYAYNQTYGGSTFNSTYALYAYNQTSGGSSSTFNSTYALYAYNQTTPANTYTDSRGFITSLIGNNTYVKLGYNPFNQDLNTTNNVRFGNITSQGNLTIGGKIFGNNVNNYLDLVTNGNIDLRSRGVGSFYFDSDGNAVTDATYFEFRNSTYAQVRIYDTNIQLRTNTNITGNSYTSGNSLISGNVGIGTLNPTQKLEVNGNVNVSGNVNISGNISVDGGIKRSFPLGIESFREGAVTLNTATNPSTQTFFNLIHYIQWSAPNEDLINSEYIQIPEDYKEGTNLTVVFRFRNNGASNEYASVNVGYVAPDAVTTTILSTQEQLIDTTSQKPYTWTTSAVNVSVGGAVVFSVAHSASSDNTNIIQLYDGRVIYVAKY